MSWAIVEIIGFAMVTTAGALYGQRTAIKQGFHDLAPAGVFVNPLVAASMARWAAGCFLFFFVVAWISNILLVGGCASVSAANQLMVDQCPRYIATRFLTLAEFQEGLGALLGLLGIAWAAVYALRPKSDEAMPKSKKN